MKKVKICSPQLGLSKESNLGGEIHDAFLLEALARKGTIIYTILPKNKDYPKHQNIHAEFLPFKKVFPPLIFNLLILSRLFALYKEQKFQILRIHSPYFVGPAAFLFKKFFPKVKLITTYHHLEKKTIFNILDKILIHHWDKIITVSQATKRELIKIFRLNPQKITVIPNGLDPKIKPQRKDQELIKKFKLSGKIVLLYLGQLIKRKNVKFLIPLIQKLPSNFSLLIVGKGPLENQLKSQISQKNLDNKVIFTDVIPKKEKVKYLNLADIFLYPSKKEGFGLTVLEAMACKKVVICSNTPALEEIIQDKENGFLLNTNQTKDWIFLIKKLVKNKRLQDKIGEEAKRRTLKFTWKKVAQTTIKIYKSQLK